MSERFDWSGVRTLDAYGRGLAAWLDYDAPPPPALMTHSLYGPYHYDGPWPMLLQAIRKGVLVVTEVWQGCTPYRARPSGCSQPYQRAALGGFVMPERAEALRRTFSSIPGLVVRIEAAGRRRQPGRYPVWADSLRQERLPLDTVWSRGDLNKAYGGKHGVHPQMVAALQAAMQVTIIDTEWGRNDVLWPALGQLV